MLLCGDEVGQKCQGINFLKQSYNKIDLKYETELHYTPANPTALLYLNLGNSEAISDAISQSFPVRLKP